MGRIDPRRRAGRRGATRAIDPQRTRRFGQARTTSAEVGPGLVQDNRGRIAPDVGMGLEVGPTGKLQARAVAPLGESASGELELRVAPSSGLRVENGRLVLKEMRPISDLDSGASLADVIAKVNDLLSGLRLVDHLKE